MRYLIRPVWDYILIGDFDGKHLLNMTGYKYLRRLFPQCDIPDGFIRVDVLYGKAVYDDNGRLLPRFWSLERFHCPGVI